MKLYFGERGIISVKECNEISQSGLYMTYIWSVHVVNTFAISYCYDMDKVRKEWKYWRKKFPGKKIHVHRFLVVGDVEYQIRKNLAAGVVK